MAVDDGTTLPQEEPHAQEWLAYELTALRAIELRLDPVAGNFDAAHLLETHRRLFQDLPGAGLVDLAPGQFRPSTGAGYSWIKYRELETRPAQYYVAYSAMDAIAHTRLHDALARAAPRVLARLPSAEFSARLAALYTELDYLHPFLDGNSRTLRAFTWQLAHAAGYALAWERLTGAECHDLLYVARDLGVNRMARRHARSERALRRILASIERITASPTLEQLLSQIIRPERAIAYEQSSPADALARHPELAPVYATMHAAAHYFAARLAGRPDDQAQAMARVAASLQARLDQGEFRPLSRNPEPQVDMGLPNADARHGRLPRD